MCASSSWLLPMRRRRRRSTGLTLVELLVVVTIAVLLVATSVPLMKPALQSGKLREASRQLSVFVQVARTRAIESGRAAGIWIERNAPGSNEGYLVFLAESPLPYQGDFVGARATAFVPPTPPSQPWWRVQFNDSLSTLLPAIVKAGDVIKFDYKGHYYPIVAVSTSGPVFVDVDTTNRPLPPNPAGLPYQIFRRPKKSMAMPLQLTGNAVIDLEYSGIGSTTTYDSAGLELGGREFQAGSATDNTPVLVIFNPTGVVDHVSFGTTTVMPDGAVHLLIGLNKNVGVPTDDQPNPLPVTSTASSVTHQYMKNVSDPGSVWVTIHPRTGGVSSAENGWQLNPPANPTFADSLRLGREYSQSAQQMGGR